MFVRSRIATIAASAASLFAVATVAAGASTAVTSPMHRTEIVLKGNQHIVVGSAADTTRAIQRATGPDVVYWPAHGALFVADASLNGVMVYDETKTGAHVQPYGILSGPNTGLDGPVAVSNGPVCTPSCTTYLFVANAGNETLTYYTLPLSAWNQAPAGTISWNGNAYCTAPSGPMGSTSPLQFPYGIVYSYPYESIIQTSEANVSGNYWISVWNATDNGPSQCLTAFTAPQYDTPSGPSIIYSNPTNFLYNANDTSVTQTAYSGANPEPVVATWSPGPGACTEGTAIDNSAYVWVTTNAGCKYPSTDAFWSCPYTKLSGGCPIPPVCKNPVAKLDFPALPGYSTLTNRLYVPNQNNGTVTAYVLNGSGGATCRPKSIYVNLQTPTGVALQN